MGIDVNETAWLILETLASHGALKANEIQNKTKKINRVTMYNAFPLLMKDGLIQRNKDKIYSLNTVKYLQSKQALQSYKDYSNLSENASKIFKNLEKQLEKHKMILSPTDTDVEIAREALRSKDFGNLINNTVRIFQLGSVMEFLINTGIFPKTVEQNAIRLRRKNEDMCSNYLKTLLKVEPVLWAQLVMLVQKRIFSKIDCN
jgi:predicted transcriptional regulator